MCHPMAKNMWAFCNALLKHTVVEFAEGLYSNGDQPQCYHIDPF